MSIGFKLKKLREKEGLSQETLAYELGISQTKLCNIENGRRKKEIGVLLMNKICKTFNKDLNHFLEEKTINYTQENKREVSSSVNNYPYNILEEVKQLVSDTLAKDRRIKELELRLSIKK